MRLAVSGGAGTGLCGRVPLLPVSDLRALAPQALAQPAARRRRVLVCQDARMDEVYWGCFERASG